MITYQPSPTLDKELELFDPITLEEMNGVRLMDRVETKFVLSAKQLPEILKRLSADYKVLDVDGNVLPSYKTVYFDTESLYFYQEHHRKRKKRSKVRFRNYVDSNLTFLEVKHKANGRIDKQRIQVENEHFVLNDPEWCFLAESDIRISDLSLKLTNNYDRITLVSKHDVERVTFDLNVNFQYGEKAGSLGDVVILELKQPTLSRQTPIYKVLRSEGIRPYNVSKYCIGLIKTHGKDNLKYNRFKKKLIQLDKIHQL